MAPAHPSSLEGSSATEVFLRALDSKLDAIHLSLAQDIAEVKALQNEDGSRISKSELRLAQLQGAGAALTLGLPFVAVALQKVLGG
jgi:hypothetical protein